MAVCASGVAQQVVPGASLGKIKLGMSTAQVKKIMGTKPTAEGAIDSSTQEMVWVGKTRTEPGFRRREFFSVFLRRGKVVQIEASSPVYKTESGLSSDSTWRQFVSEFPGGKLKARTYPWDEESLVLYAGDHVANGITWVRGAIGKDMPPAPDRSRKIDFVAVHPVDQEFIFGLTHPEVWKKGGVLVPPAQSAAAAAGNAATAMANQFRLGPKIGELTPALVTKTTDGRSFDLNAVIRRSKAVVLNFWFSSLDASRRELPTLAEMYEYYKADGLMVIGINAQDSMATIKQFVTSKKLKFPMISDRDGLGPTKTFGIIDYPTTIVLGKDGKVVDIIVGTNEERLRKALEKVGFAD